MTHVLSRLARSAFVLALSALLVPAAGLAQEGQHHDAQPGETPGAHGDTPAEGGHGHAVPKPPSVDFSFNGPFGTWDKAQLQRGFQVYAEVCAACHGLHYVSFRHLVALGYDEREVRQIAADWPHQVPAAPNDDGEVLPRAPLPTDRIVGPYANDNAARAANNGAVPPDLSLMTKARPNGTNYIVALLTGYEEAPAGTEMMAGMYYNRYFPGYQIAMAPPLTDGRVTYFDPSPPADAANEGGGGSASHSGVPEETVHQMAVDVAAFLTWSAEPFLVERKRLGLQVLLFLGVLTFLVWRIKKIIWEKVHHGEVGGRDTKEPWPLTVHGQGGSTP